MGLETAAIVAIGASIAAGAVSAYSSYQQGQAAKAQGKYEARVAANNQVAAQHQTDAEMANIRSKYRRVRGAQVAAGAASGMSSSLMSDIFQAANMQEDMDTLGLLYSSKTQSVAQSQHSQLAGMKAKQGQIEGNLGVASSILSTAGDVYGSYPTLVN